MACIRPRFGRGRQACTDGILRHVGPLLRVALTCTQNVIKKPVLPERSRALKHGEHSFCGPFFPSLHKRGQGFRRVRRGTEKMHMVGHDHVTADPPPVPRFRREPFLPKERVNGVVGQKPFSALRASRHEINRSLHPNVIEPPQVRLVWPSAWPDRWSGGLGIG